MTTYANDNFLAVDTANLTAEIANLIAAYPELAEDGDLRADMLEAETNLHGVLTRLLSAEREANSMQAAIKDRVDDLAARKKRHERKQEAMRLLMLRLMQAADLPKVSLPEATVSVGKGRASVEITDEKAVPPRFLKVVKTPDKTLIKAALDAGKKVNGAAIKEGQPTLTVRAA